jgi:hypothetical protein
MKSRRSTKIWNALRSLFNGESEEDPAKKAFHSRLFSYKDPMADVNPKYNIVWNPPSIVGLEESVFLSPSISDESHLEDLEDDEDEDDEEDSDTSSEDWSLSSMLEATNISPPSPESLVKRSASMSNTSIKSILKPARSSSISIHSKNIQTSPSHPNLKSTKKESLKHSKSSYLGSKLKINAPAPEKLYASSNSSTKSCRFDSTVLVFETYHPGDYDRAEPEHPPMTGKELEKIYLELRRFKLKEMTIHPNSVHNISLSI